MNVYYKLTKSSCCFCIIIKLPLNHFSNSSTWFFFCSNTTVAGQ
jgi:hypothetical protein